MDLSGGNRFGVDLHELFDYPQASSKGRVDEHSPLNDEAPRLVSRLPLGEKIAQPPNRGARETNG